MLDSVQGRGPCLAFLPFCSLPELESYYHLGLYGNNS